MNNVYSLNKSALISLEKQILKTAQVLDELRKKIIFSMPSRYGSQLWWEKEEIQADEEIAKGKIKEYRKVDDLIEHLDSLSSKSTS